MGASLPWQNYRYQCYETCMYYFNINGSFNDKSQIYLVVFVNDYIHQTNINVILKNNKWIENFNNHGKLEFPQTAIINEFGCDFMVCNVIYFIVSILF